MERKLVGPHLRLADSRPAKTAPRSSVSKAAAKAKLESAEQLLPLPSGSFTYGSREAAFRAIGLDKGSHWEIGRAAVGEKGWQLGERAGVADSLNKKKKKKQ